MRKTPKKLIKKSIYQPAIYLVTVTFILLSILVIVGTSRTRAQSVVTKVKAEATSSAQPISVTPKPQPKSDITSLPQTSGRSVRVPIIYYHYIGNNPNPEDKQRDNLSVSPDLFDAQMGYLAKAGYTPITLDTLVAALRGEADLPAKPIVITFDDGYVDLYLNAFQILRKYSFKAVAFIPTGLVGTSYYASWDQLLEMKNSGLVVLEAHSVNHVNLAAQPQDRLLYEVKESRKVLQEKTGLPINFMAYPYGTSDSTAWEAAKNAGYIGALGTWSSTFQSEGTIFDMPRIKIAGGTSVENFAAKL